jgi:hypothetical protein
MVHIVTQFAVTQARMAGHGDCHLVRITARNS